MECSTATLKRHLSYLRDILGAPIINKRGVGYFYDPNISFALERMNKVQLQQVIAINVSETELNEKLVSAYGIFSGEADKKAILHFTSQRARWVADETWHPEQSSLWLDDGTYELTIPYANDTELILDICRYGPDVEVIGPESLRQSVVERLKAAVDQYA